MPNRYQVTSLEICAQGMERLRNRDEFILVSYAWRGATAPELARDWEGDLRAVDRGDSFDWDSAYACLQMFAHSNADSIAERCADLPETEGDEDSGIVALLYVRDLEHGEAA